MHTVVELQSTSNHVFMRAIAIIILWDLLLLTCMEILFIQFKTPNLRKTQTWKTGEAVIPFPPVPY